MAPKKGHEENITALKQRQTDDAKEAKRALKVKFKKKIQKAFSTVKITDEA